MYLYKTAMCQRFTCGCHSGYVGKPHVGGLTLELHTSDTRQWHRSLCRARAGRSPPEVNVDMARRQDLGASSLLWPAGCPALDLTAAAPAGVWRTKNK